MKSVKQLVLEQLEQPTFAFVTDDEQWVEIKEYFFVDPEVYRSPNYKPVDKNAPKPSLLAVKPTAAVTQVKPSQVKDEALADGYCKNYGRCKRHGFNEFACDHHCILKDGQWHNGLCLASAMDEAIAMDVKSCQASLAECTAKNPMYCPYHGTMLMQEDLRKSLLAAGVKGKIDVVMDKGSREDGKGFSVTVHCPASQAEKVRQQLKAFMSQPGITQNEDEPDLSYDKTDKGITAYFDVDVLKADEPPKDAPAAKEDVEIGGIDIPPDTLGDVLSNETDKQNTSSSNKLASSELDTESISQLAEKIAKATGGYPPSIMSILDAINNGDNNSPEFMGYGPNYFLNAYQSILPDEPLLEKLKNKINNDDDNSTAQSPTNENANPTSQTTTPPSKTDQSEEDNPITDYALDTLIKVAYPQLKDNSDEFISTKEYLKKIASGDVPNAEDAQEFLQHLDMDAQVGPSNASLSKVPVFQSMMKKLDGMIDHEKNSTPSDFDEEDNQLSESNISTMIGVAYPDYEEDLKQQMTDYYLSVANGTYKGDPEIVKTGLYEMNHDAMKGKYSVPLINNPTFKALVKKVDELKQNNENEANSTNKPTDESLQWLAHTILESMGGIKPDSFDENACYKALKDIRDGKYNESIDKDFGSSQSDFLTYYATGDKDTINQLKEIAKKNDEKFENEKSQEKSSSSDIYEDAAAKLKQGLNLGDGGDDFVELALENHKETGKFSNIDSTNKELEGYFKPVLGDDHPIFSHVPGEPTNSTEESTGSESAVDRTPVKPTMDDFPKLPDIPDSLDGLERVIDPNTNEPVQLGGSTGPELWKDKNGTQFIVKRGGGSNPQGHVINEYNGLKAYRAMGVFCPDAKLIKDGNGTVMIENFVKGTGLGDFLDNCSAKERKDIINQIKQTSFADILLGNWDAAGTPDSTAGNYPNMMVVDGKLCRIDPGGWGRYRAQGGLKADKDWKDGYPNELFTMKQFGTTRDFLSDVHPYDILQQIDGLDLSEMVEGLPEDDRAVMESRLSECKDLAETGRNYVVDGQYTKDFADDILKMSLSLHKKGGKKACNFGTLTLDDMTTTLMNQPAPGNEAGSDLATIAPKIGEIEKKIDYLSKGHDFNFSDARLAILKAVKSINHHAANGDKPNMETLKTALGYSKDIDAAFKQISSEPTSPSTAFLKEELKDYSNWLGKINEVFVSGTAKNIGQWDVDTGMDIFPLFINPTEDDYKEIGKLNAELTDLNKQYSAIAKSGHSELQGLSPKQIVDVLLKEDNLETGLNASSGDVLEAIRYQGIETWESGNEFWTGHLLKFAECMAMGEDWTKKPIYDHESANVRHHIASSNDVFTTPQFMKLKSGAYAFCGIVQATRPADDKSIKTIGQAELSNESQAAMYNKTISNMKLDPTRMKTFYRSYIAWKAVQSAIFANTKMQYADKGHCMVKRQLRTGIAKTYGLQPGKFSVFPCGMSESASYSNSSYDQAYDQSYKPDSTKNIYGGSPDYAIMANIPVSRIIGMFTWGDPFDHYGEREFGVNLVGIPTLVVNEFSINPEAAHRYDHYKTAMNGRTTIPESEIYRPKLGNLS